MQRLQVLLFSVASCSAAVATPAPAPSGGGMDFLSIGDWGDTGAKKIAGFMGTYQPQYVLAIGDNFYNSGVSGDNDPQFEDKFEQTFTASSLQVPWYVCAGNHDYYGGTKGVQAEMDYTKTNKRWHYPSLYFDFVQTAPDGTSVHILSIDTWRLCGGDQYIAFDPVTGRGAIKNITQVKEEHKLGLMDKGKMQDILSTFEQEDPNDPINVRATPDAAQEAWIDATLGNSTSTWRIVMGHFPVYSASAGEHGDTTYLVNYLEPILAKHKVHAYFAGHDHILQHIQKDAGGTHFFGSGAGARTHSNVNTSYAGLKGYNAGHYGFMYHHIDSKSFTTSFVDDTGAVKYSAAFAHF